MTEVILKADESSLDDALEFVEDSLESSGCSLGDRRQIAIAVEEVFINIASYAYEPDTGNVTLRIDLSEDPAAVTITLIDQGIPFDPLTLEDPDTDLPAKQRKVGGLGIFVVKNFMDEISYEYRDGQNILTMKKRK